MEENAGGAGAHYYAHAAALGTAGGKAVVNPVDQFCGHFLNQGVCKHFCPFPVAPRGGFVLQLSVLLENRGDRDAAHGAGVPFELPGAVEHEDVRYLESQVGHHFNDTCITLTYSLLQFL